MKIYTIFLCLMSSGFYNQDLYQSFWADPYTAIDIKATDIKSNSYIKMIWSINNSVPTIGS